MANHANQTRGGYDEQAGPYLNKGSIPVPDITSWTPSRGTRDTIFHVYFTTLYPLLTVTAYVPTFFLMFGQRKCQASLQKLNQVGSVYAYNITAKVPEFSSTGFSASNVPVCMFMESGDGDIICKNNIGTFTYVDDGKPANRDINSVKHGTQDVEMADFGLSSLSHNYDMYNQQTGIFQGSVASTLVLNEMDQHGYADSYLSGIGGRDFIDFGTTLKAHEMPTTLPRPDGIGTLVGSSRAYPTAEDWESHRPLITRLYLDERRKLSEVAGILASQYGHYAT
jgi:hypothetical protein